MIGGRRKQTIVFGRFHPKHEGSAASGRPEPNDFGAIESALNEAAARLRNLWISYLLLSTYLMISVGSVTHRMLFLETPIRLPVLNVDLPLNGFFFVAPILFLIFHVYLLLQLSLMAQRARDYNATVAAFGFASEDENRLRQRIDSSVILQFIAGPKHRDYKRLSAMLALIAWVTMAVAPVMLLVFIQLQYLPYHHPWITWLHRSCVVVDILFLWAFWGGISEGRAIWPGWERIGKRMTIAGSLLVLVFCFVAAYPGEQHYDWVRANLRLIPEHERTIGAAKQAPRTGSKRQASGISLTEYLFEGDIDDVKGGTAGVFANRIIVPDQNFVDENELADIRRQEQADGKDLKPGEFRILNSFRGRDLRGAVLDRSDLRRSDFTSTDLDGASLDEARLDRSIFGCSDTARVVGIDERTPEEKEEDHDCASLVGSTLDRAEMADVSMRYEVHIYSGRQRYSADLEGNQRLAESVAESRPNLSRVSLVESQLRGAILHGAKLLGANLKGAHLTEASLQSTQLQGATLDDANLQSASLRDAQLQGASLNKAHLQGATLQNAFLLGTSLEKAQLQGAWLGNAWLLGASLFAANLQGAHLNSAWLQGASLRKADLQGASLVDAYLWRAEASRISNDTNIRVGSWVTGDGFDDSDYALRFALQELAPDVFPDVMDAALDLVFDEEIRKRIESRLKVLDPNGAEPDGAAGLRFMQRVRDRFDPVAHAEYIHELACADQDELDDAPHVARGLIRSGFSSFGQIQFALKTDPGISQSILDGIKDKTCPGSLELDEDSMARLRDWALDKPHAETEKR